MQHTPLPTSIGRPATNALSSHGINYLEDLKSVSEKELAKLHGVGPKALNILKQTLSQHNLNLAP